MQKHEVQWFVGTQRTVDIAISETDSFRLKKYLARMVVNS